METIKKGVYTMTKLPNFDYEIKKKYGVISQFGTQTKELNLISYNGASEKYDLRIWFEDKEKKRQMGKGLTLNEEEIIALKDILNGLALS